MHGTRNDLSRPIRTKVVDLLDARLADAIDLQTQLERSPLERQGGPPSSGSTSFFDKINEAVEDYVDDLAERVVQLGGVAHGTARQAAKSSTLPEFPAVAGCHDHVEAVATVLAACGKLARAGIDRADGLGDKDTADLFTEISRGVDKWLWFVEAHLQADR
jgi:starvation-inducible DNA-binding protein